MKTLKTITTTLLLLFTVTAFSQTKEETLEWLKQNGDSYLKFYNIYTYDDGSSQHVSYSYQFYEEYFEEKEFSSYMEKGDIGFYTRIYYKDIFVIEDIATLDTERWTSNISSSSSPTPTYIKIPIKKYESTVNRRSYIFSEKIDSRFSFKYDADQPNARKNIDKVLRAIMNMAKLSGAEPYKDLFGE